MYIENCCNLQCLWLGSCSKRIVNDSGFPMTPDRPIKLFGNSCMLSKVCWDNDRCTWARFLRRFYHKIIVRLMRSVKSSRAWCQWVVRTYSYRVCSCRKKIPWLRFTAEGPRPKARGERRCPARLLSSSARNGRNSLLSVTWAIRFNGRVTRGTG